MDVVQFVTLTQHKLVEKVERGLAALWEGHPQPSKRRRLNSFRAHFVGARRGYLEREDLPEPASSAASSGTIPLAMDSLLQMSKWLVGGPALKLQPLPPMKHGLGD